ncbi:hypothetical protein Cgig2_032151 [Carnegiea gigantea]|uniref:SWIM-type domain-containing protein n=1 Tax=Carnegiea gigantea TaxID=171969 RepID=A0A9Q1GRP5_9CARY|nr:hypothetical protein Cgig2_032151 [Carnegiea gigantea]
MGLEEVRRKVSEITSNDLTVWKLWYNLKYDRGMFLKGNDEHGYLYVGESDGWKRRTQKATRTCDDGVVRRRSNSDRDDMVEEGRKGAGVKRAAVSESGRCIDDHPQIRLRVGREITEMSDDDEISVASKDVGEDEAAAEGGEESSKGKEVMKGAMPMRACGHGRVCKHKATIIGERIEQKLAGTYQKMGCIAAVEYYSLMLGEYSVELPNSHKLVVNLEQQTYMCRVQQIRGIPCYHALAVIAKENLWVYNYVHPTYKIATRQIIYSQLSAPDGDTRHGDELDDDYDRCILSPLMGDNWVVEPHQVAIHKYPQLIDSFKLYSYWVVSCEHTLTLVCVLIIKYSFACSLRRQMFTVVNHGLQPINPWQEADVDHGKPWSPSGTPLGKLIDCSYGTLAFCSNCLVSCRHTPTPICNLLCLPSIRPMFTVVNHGLQVFIGACAWGPGNLACSPGRRQMLTVVKHGAQAVNPLGSDRHGHSWVLCVTQTHWRDMSRR